MLAVDKYTKKKSTHNRMLWIFWWVPNRTYIEYTQDTHSVFRQVDLHWAYHTLCTTPSPVLAALVFRRITTRHASFGNSWRRVSAGLLWSLVAPPRALLHHALSRARRNRNKTTAWRRPTSIRRSRPSPSPPCCGYVRAFVWRSLFSWQPTNRPQNAQDLQLKNEVVFKAPPSPARIFLWATWRVCV